jgi:hypothetical protein
MSRKSSSSASPKPSTPSLESLSQFLDALGTVANLLDAAVKGQPWLPEGWDQYGEFLAVLHRHRADVEALLVLHGRRPPQEAGRIVDQIISAYTLARVQIEQRPYPRQYQERVQVRDSIRGEDQPLRQLLAIMRAEAESRLEAACPPEVPADRGQVVEQPAEGGPAAGLPKPEAKSDVSLDARAVGVFLDHPDWTKKRIAKLLGCNEKSLCPERCPKLTAAIAAHKSPIDPGRRRLRGSKDSDGNLEAWEDE